MPYRVHPKLFFQKGMSFAERGPEFTAANYSRFRSHFGTSPGVCSILWDHIQPTLALDLQATFSHLLWALMFLKVYSSESVLAGKCNAVDEKTYREKVRPIVEAIAKIKPKIVSKTLMYMQSRCAVLP